MKLDEPAIKQALLHSEPIVRDAALAYFARCFTQDCSVMPVVVQAMESRGWEQAFEYTWMLQHIPQTDETLTWLVGQLDESALLPETTCLRIGAIVCKADAELLARHESVVTGCPRLDAKAHKTIREKIRLLSVPGDACWQDLETLCERHKGDKDSTRFDFGHASRLVEAISREGDRHAPRVLSILSEKVEDVPGDPLGWLKIFVAQLAGLLRLEAAAPLLAATLKDDDGDFNNEECMYALTKIGGQAAVQAIVEDFDAAPEYFRHYAASALRDMRGDEVVTAALKLLHDEPDSDVAVTLLRTALDNFDSRGLQAAREFGLIGDPELRRPLVATATLSGADLPELEQLRETEREHRAEVKRREQWLLGTPQPPAKPSVESAFTQPPVQPNRSQRKIGRNEPCPCGSGKKYKKCCLGKYE